MNILMVCLGNICRSPIAEAVVREHLQRAGMDEVRVDSAGCSDYHRDKAPDKRAQQVCSQHGYDLSTQRSRPVEMADFYEYGLICAMDSDNLHWLKDNQPANATGAIRLFLPGDAEVPDPYYGGENGFEQVLELIEMGSVQLVDALKQ